MVLTPGTRVGPFEVTGHIGAGGMGEVYRATDSNLKRSVAIKVLPALAADADRLARFQREAEVLAVLNHRNIATISDVLAAVLRQDIDWTALPAETPARLRRLLERCLDRGVKERLRDLGEARVEIAKIQTGAPDTTMGAASVPVICPSVW